MMLIMIIYLRFFRESCDYLLFICRWWNF